MTWCFVGRIQWYHVKKKHNDDGDVIMMMMTMVVMMKTVMKPSSQCLGLKYVTNGTHDYFLFSVKRSLGLDYMEYM